MPVRNIRDVRRAVASQRTLPLRGERTVHPLDSRIGNDVRMVRALIRLALILAGNALGLWVASLLVDDMSLSASGFIIAVVVFTVLAALLQPLIVKLASKKAPALESGSALVSTFLALLITTLVSDGLNISGVSTWILATVIVWVVTLIAGIAMPLLLLKDDADKK